MLLTGLYLGLSMGFFMGLVWHAFVSPLDMTS